MDKQSKEIATIGAAMTGALLISYSLYKTLAPAKAPLHQALNRPLPCIVSDMDGVIVKGDEPINDAPKIV